MVSDRLLDGRLKLRHLVLLVRIEEAGSLAAAAEALHITQPVVTRGLREVEDILGVSLFERGRRGVTPTIFGEAFLEHARAVIAQLRQADRQIEQLAQADLGTVTVGTHLAGSNVVLPRAIVALKEAHPRLTVVVREATPDALQAALLAGECDLVLGRLTGSAPSSIVQHMLYREPIRVVVREGHPVTRFGEPSLSQLAPYPWVLPVDQTTLRQELEDAFLHEGVDLPANRIECTTILTLRELVLTSDAVAVLPELIATRDRELVVLDAPLGSIRRAVGVSRAKNRPLSPAAHALLEHLRAQASALPRER
jgi:DNA-binding transcriptional LysR family regulator